MADIHDTTTLVAADGTALFVYRWVPEHPKAIVQIAHGMAEHAARYDRFARFLAAHGFAVYAHDHRGHGRTAGSVEKVGSFGEGAGWDTTIEDLHVVTEHAREQQPSLPVFLLGHSMGSAMARHYAIWYGHDLAGLILSGTMGDPGTLGKVGKAIAAAEGRLRGRATPSGLLDKMTFGQFNASFKPNRTSFDWLSRDGDEVDAYIADPYCGGVFSSGFFSDFLGGLAYVNDDANVMQVPDGLPIYLFSGAEDPVGDKGVAVAVVQAQLARGGVSDVTMKLYPEGRHEMLNETNRDQVYADVLAWLEAHLPE